MFTSLFYLCIESLFVFPCQWNYRPDHCIYGSNCQEAEEEGIFILHGNRGVYHDDKQPAFRAIYEALRNVSSFFFWSVLWTDSLVYREFAYPLLQFISIKPTTPSPHSSGTWCPAGRKGTAFCPLTDLCVISMSSLILFFSANYNQCSILFILMLKLCQIWRLGAPFGHLLCLCDTFPSLFWVPSQRGGTSKISQAYLIMPSLPSPWN